MAENKAVVRLESMAQISLVRTQSECNCRDFHIKQTDNETVYSSKVPRNRGYRSRVSAYPPFILQHTLNKVFNIHKALRPGRDCKPHT